MSPDIAQGIRLLLDAYDEKQKFPLGPEVDNESRIIAGHACVKLCGGDQDKGRTLWKRIADRCGGYMPQAAAIALVLSSDVTNLVPDVTPEGDLG